MKIKLGNIITSMLNAEYDVAVQGCNTLSLQRSGLAAQMAETFRTDDIVRYEMESIYETERIFHRPENKLGCIDYADFYVNRERAIFVTDLTRGRRDEPIVTIVNCYTQAYPGRVFTGDIPLDYEALTLCMKKINYFFKEKTVAIPYLIGGGLAKGDHSRILEILNNTLVDVIPTLIQLP